MIQQDEAVYCTGFGENVVNVIKNKYINNKTII